MQQYYRLMKSILFVLFLSFGMISCEKEEAHPKFLGGNYL